MRPGVPALKMAHLIHRRLSAASGSAHSLLASAVSDLQSTSAALNSVWRKIEKARRRGWHAAAGLLGDQLCSLTRSLNDCTSILQSRQVPEAPAPPTLRLIVEELRQLEEEFGEGTVTWVLKGETGVRVMAVTESITLKDVALGRFQIQLYVGRLDARADSSCFEIVALDPNPASSNSEVTHPHVSEQSLCAGDAALGISQALRQGRIADACVLVRSVLQTYNASSPYVSLDDWEGESCSDCGDRVPVDDLSTCQSCHCLVCPDCISSCDVCDASTCRGCLELDRRAGLSCCSDCRNSCVDCGRTVAEKQWDQESECCPQCHAVREAESDSEDSEDSPESPATDFPSMLPLEVIDSPPAVLPSLPDLPSLLLTKDPFHECDSDDTAPSGTDLSAQRDAHLTPTAA